MLLNGVNHVAILVNDTERLHGFYRDVFDATVSRDVTEADGVSSHPGPFLPDGIAPAGVAQPRTAAAPRKRSHRRSRPEPAPRPTPDAHAPRSSEARPVRGSPAPKTAPKTTR